MSFIVCAYYTKNTMYEKCVVNLKESLKKFNVPNDVQGVTNLGSWIKNVNYKPTFIKEMLKKHSPLNVVYVDSDAVFLKYPKLFETLDCQMSAHILKKPNRTELLSGTIFIKNNEVSESIIDKWIEICKNKPEQWEQKSLQELIHTFDFKELPAEYCKIFDIMRNVKNAVIEHYQQSRQVRKNKGCLI